MNNSHNQTTFLVYTSHLSVHDANAEPSQLSKLKLFFLPLVYHTRINKHSEIDSIKVDKCISFRKHTCRTVPFGTVHGKTPVQPICVKTCRHFIIHTTSLCHGYGYVGEPYMHMYDIIYVHVFAQCTDTNARVYGFVLTFVCVQRFRPVLIVPIWHTNERRTNTSGIQQIAPLKFAYPMVYICTRRLAVYVSM